MSEKRYRLVVLGSGKVGKTSIIRRYLYGTFDDKYKETVEDLYSRNFCIQGMTVSVDILDTNFDYPDMRKVAVVSANAFMLVFAVNDVPSFKQMSDTWSEIVQQRKDARTIPTVVVGNKCDLLSQKIFEATAQAWTQRLNSNIRYVEASAKTTHNIVKIFRNLLEQSGLLDEEKTGALSPYSPNERCTDKLTTALSEINVSDRSHIEAKIAKASEPKGLERTSSFLWRSKHLSLKMRRHEKGIAVAQQDESDCKIS